MKQPSLDLLMQQVDSKYTLVVAAAKRARTIMEDTNNEELAKGVKAVSLALQEIAEGKLHFERTREGIK
ncbi:MAG: DNA-directed RNA polymerase subunit omega [Desulfitobacteriaceae bacterium]|nr:DNA-directed RNA polymerase subunit omega [Desulfitobacteriaceae bacterium]MDI6880719.1 DNA-directed RNA polymerase subunit omega [Desulfitobacteriaceae bacterium]MDI6915705.1 DNA-directed RNA polymerase subunit omega [Desulfitobacteriaceae bacterium]